MATAIYSRSISTVNVTDAVHSIRRGLNRLANHFLASLEVARQRRDLLRLDDRALNDTGIRRSDARKEAMRGFWNIPEDMKTRD